MNDPKVALVQMITATLDVLGQEMSADAIAMLTADMLDELPNLETAAMALRQLRRSGKRLTLANILQFAGVPAGQEAMDAAGVLAWDKALEFAERFTTIPAGGEDYVPSKFGQAPERYAALGEQTIAAVRRVGGWSAIRCTPDAELHWIKKRFMEEFSLFNAVDYISNKQLNEGNSTTQLIDDGIRKLSAGKAVMR